MQAGSELVAVDLNLHEVRWRHENDNSYFGISARPFEWKGAVLVGDKLGGVLAFRTSDGAQLWTYTFEGEAPRSF